MPFGGAEAFPYIFFGLALGIAGLLLKFKAWLSSWFTPTPDVMACPAGEKCGAAPDLAPQLLAPVVEALKDAVEAVAEAPAPAAAPSTMTDAAA